ncbi:hypothetical protein ES703_111760 [subsurface metagenome]
MAELVNKPQAIRVGVKHPNPGYSRVVSCLASPKGLGAVDYGFTSVVGQSVRLLSVRLFFLPLAPDETRQVYFKIVTMTYAPLIAESLYRNESVLPLTWKGAGVDRWRHFAGRDTYVWTMNQLYEGAGRRFGIWAQCNWAGLDEIYASFQISEG